MTAFVEKIPTLRAEWRTLDGEYQYQSWSIEGSGDSALLLIDPDAIVRNAIKLIRSCATVDQASVRVNFQIT